MLSGCKNIREFLDSSGQLATHQGRFYCMKFLRYHIFLNIRQQFSGNLSSDKWGGRLIIAPNVNMFGVGKGRQTICMHVNLIGTYT